MPYNKEEATQFLVDKFGYQRYSQKHFESRFTKFYESYWLPKKFGFDTRKVQYSIKLEYCTFLVSNPNFLGSQYDS